ncbi:MAG: DUF374 domain-containing protein [Planctomycetota bacterium]
MNRCVAFAIAGYVLFIRYTSTFVIHGDPRAILERDHKEASAAVCLLHAHQIATAAYGSKNTAAMVSQSRDGDLIAMTLRLTGVNVVRGSSGRGKSDRGGIAALGKLQHHIVGQGYVAITSDGPRGPRGKIHKGVSRLSQTTNAPVVCAMLVPRRRIIFRGAWDRMQLPMPFNRIDVHFSAPLTSLPDESCEAFRSRIQQMMSEMERRADPDEAEYSVQETISVRQPTVESRRAA